jgi:bacteriorhodopsin
MGGKGFLIAILMIVAAVTADQHFNFGYYTDGALAMLDLIKQAFGF